MRGLEHDQSLEGDCIPDMNGRFVCHFSCGHNLPEGVFGYATDLLVVALIETLPVVMGSVDYSVARSEVDYVFSASQVFGFVGDSV